MKTKFILIFLIISYFFNLAYPTDEKIIVCPSSTEKLSQLFAREWNKSPEQSYYLSHVRWKIGDLWMSGTLHTLDANLPFHHNPHLLFSHLQVNEVTHYQVWQIDCRYTIGNPFFQDLADGYLHMTVDVLDFDYDCIQLSNSAAICTSR